MDRSTPKSAARRLVSVRRISQIKPLASSETREVVMVEGWPVVVPKGRFVANELILYFEIDSFLPFNDERFESYRHAQVYAELHGRMGWVVQPVILDGHISQGMVFRLHDFCEVSALEQDFLDEIQRHQENPLEEITDADEKIDAMLMDYDFTDQFDFKVEKWATLYPVDGGIDLGRPPSFVPDTKLERAQNLPKLWETHGNTEFEITELLEGLPMTVYRVNEYGPEYRKLPGMLIEDNLFPRRPGWGISIGDHDYGETEESRSWAAMRLQGIIKEVDRHRPHSQVVLAGVLCGVGISGNPYQIPGRRRFYVHSMSDPHTMKRFTMDETEEWRDRRSRTCELVPTFSQRIRLSAFAKNMDELMMKAEGGSWVPSEGRSCPKRKGLVFKALDGSLNFKAVSNGWLLNEARKLRGMSEDARCRSSPIYYCD